MIVNDPAGLRRILQESRVIAVVGLSSNKERPSYRVAQYLLAHGYTVIPVNPAEREILGQKCYASLEEIPQKVDVVDCFRKSADIPPLAESAIAIGAKTLWLQLEIVNDAAAKAAAAAGLNVVQDRCIKVDHAQLLT
jgi:predicted CoA-binding protein